MKPDKGLSFEEDRETFIREAISRFVKESEANLRAFDGRPFFADPLVAFASGHDPLFEQYNEIIGDFHFNPRKIFDLTFGKGTSDKGISVISWVLPICQDTRDANRKEDKFPALLWSHTRFFGEPFNDVLRRYVVALLESRGYKAVAPAISPEFVHHMHAPRVGFTSNWSERHTAYVCGLGTFGLCDGLITPKGKAMRLGSVVTDLHLTPSERPYADRHANCLFYTKGTCKACAARCPAGAITDKGHDKEKCFQFMHDVSAPAKAEGYGVKITGCGLCQTKVPCEFEIPKAIAGK